MHVNEANSKSLIQRLPSAFSRLQFSFQLERKEEKGISRADLCILTPLQFYWCLNRRPAFSFFFFPSTCTRILRNKMIAWRIYELMLFRTRCLVMRWLQRFFVQTQKWWDKWWKKERWADTEVEEEPKSYWRIWETPGFCLWRENRKKPNPEAFYVNSASKKTKPDPNKKTQPPQ